MPYGLLVRTGDLILQPSEERRRSGSHYTPRELTEPIVRDTLKPILDRLRRETADTAAPRPEQILDLKVCDPAMGSGAFLVEACRQLADVLVDSWHAHDAVPPIPPDEDETVHARRLVARNCLYGVDRNPVAVDLAKLSLWLVTLARDHPLTFLDHALREGDSLVGLTLEQIQAFHWKGGEKRFQAGIETTWIREQVEKALRLRREIQDAGDETPDWELRSRLEQADNALVRVKRSGHLVLAAFFRGGKPMGRETLREEFLSAIVGGGNATSTTMPRPTGVSAVSEPNGHGEAHLPPASELDPTLLYASWLDELRHAARPLAPFHWQIEFPEVFLPGDRPSPGFDAVVGNPPFLGGTRVSENLGPAYRDWLLQAHKASSSRSDLVAHFLRRAFSLLRSDGCLGFIATNTIAQGDTRATGLRYVCEHGGEIYRAKRRVKWPGLAAVVVSIVHLCRGPWRGRRRLDDKPVERITAFLFHRGEHRDPARLGANARKSFEGSKLQGMGFTFDDRDAKGIASPLAEMERLVEADPRNRQAISPYIGGKEVNASPTHAHHRHAINFREYPLRRYPVGESWAEADKDRRREWLRRGTVPKDYPDPVAADWPELLRIVEQRVKPQRELKDPTKYPRMVYEWWKYWNARQGLHAAIADLDYVLGVSNVGQHAAFAFLPANMVYANTLIILPLPTNAAFCALQSRPHELWARFFGSSMKDDLR